MALFFAPLVPLLTGGFGQAVAASFLGGLGATLAANALTRSSRGDDDEAGLRRCCCGDLTSGLAHPLPSDWLPAPLPSPLAGPPPTDPPDDQTLADRAGLDLDSFLGIASAASSAGVAAEDLANALAALAATAERAGDGNGDAISAFQRFGLHFGGGEYGAPEKIDELFSLVAHLAENDMLYGPTALRSHLGDLFGDALDPISPLMGLRVETTNLEPARLSDGFDFDKFVSDLLNMTTAMSLGGMVAGALVGVSAGPLAALGAGALYIGYAISRDLLAESPASTRPADASPAIDTPDDRRPIIVPAPLLPPECLRFLDPSLVPSGAPLGEGGGALEVEVTVGGRIDIHIDADCRPTVRRLDSSHPDIEFAVDRGIMMGGP